MVFFLFSEIIKLTYLYLDKIFFYIYFFILLSVYIISLTFLCAKFTNIRSNINILIFFLLVTLLYSPISTYLSVLFFSEYIQGYLFYSGAADTYLLGKVFQPSLFGVLFITSIYFFLVGRWIVASLCIGIVCNIHSTFLLTGASLTIAYMAIFYFKEKNFYKSLTIGTFNLILVSPILISLLFAITSQIETAEAYNIQINLRAPHHHLITHWFGYDDIARLIVIFLALIVTYRSNLFIILVVPFFVCIFLTLIQFFSNSEFLAMLMPWRITAILLPLSFFLLLVKVLELILNRYFQRQLFKKIFCLILLVGVLFSTFLGIKNFNKSYHNYYSKNYSEMMKYISNNKDSQDIYFIPTNLNEFRLRTGSPIFIDFQLSPQLSGDKMEWYRRINKSKEINSAINENDCLSLTKLIEAKEFTHIVFFNQQDIKCKFLELEYADDYFKVVEININNL